MSDRTFNLNVLNVADKDALQGIINGDKNGLFKVGLSPTQPEPNPSLNPILTPTPTPTLT